mgnify:CR=1 FL=1
MITSKKLIVFSAPSGAGKTTLVKYLLSMFNKIEFSISATSRKPRGKEKDGVDYYFLTDLEFKERINKKKFVEYEEVYGGYFYGTLKSELKRIWEDNKIVIFDIDVVGGFNIKEMFPKETLSVFVMPPSLEILEKRLIDRGDISKDEIRMRIKKAKNELDFASKFDNIIINGDLKESKEIAFSIIKKFIENE